MQWPGKRAVLLVHGVGNAKPGDYAPLAQQVESLLGASASQFAVYFLYYDQINDWLARLGSGMAMQVTDVCCKALRGKLWAVASTWARSILRVAGKGDLRDCLTM